MKNFFVSYNSEDKAWAEWISWQLEDVGYTCVVQAWDFRPGMNFVLAMRQAAEDSERTLSVLSSAFLLAKYTQPEWASAFAADPTGEQGRLVPVRVDEVEPSGIWKSIVYIDLVGLSETDARAALIEGIGRGRQKPPVPPPFPVTFPVESTDLAVAPIYPRFDIEVSNSDDQYAELRVELYQGDEIRTTFREAGTRLTSSTGGSLNEEKLRIVRDTVAKEESSTTSLEPLRSLFFVLIPPSLHERLSCVSVLGHRVDEDIAWLPWELILCPHMAESTGMGTLIRLGKSAFRRLTPPDNEPTIAKALVIGGPGDGESLDQTHSIAEANAVSRQLNAAGIVCHLSVKETAEKVINALFQEPYAIVHVAGDAVASSRFTGIALGDDLWLTAAEFDQMRYVPELIFLNVREIRPDPDRISPNNEIVSDLFF